MRQNTSSNQNLVDAMGSMMSQPSPRKVQMENQAHVEMDLEKVPREELGFVVDVGEVEIIEAV